MLSRTKTVALTVAICFALLHAAAATGNSYCYGLIGKWQGTCVTKGWNGKGEGDCAEDLLSFPYYVEYSWDSYQGRCLVHYRSDEVTIDTWRSSGSGPSYSIDSYHDSGYFKPYPSGDGYCLDVFYDSSYDNKRTYRVKYKHEGELDVLIEEGYYKNDGSHYGWNFGQCPNKSWKSLYCGSDRYSYRCYLVRTNSWTWSW